jgi:hypothetical protein
MAALVVLVAESDLAMLQSHETMVGDGDTVRIACQILQDVLGLPERFFGVDDPVLGAYVGEALAPRLGRGELATAPPQGQVALSVELRQTREVEMPEAAREDPDGQEEVGAARDPSGAIGCQPPGGEDTMEMGVMMELLAPGVQHGKAPDLGPEMRGLLSDVLEGLRDGAKEQAIELARVLQRQRPEIVRQGKNHMDVGCLKELAFPGGEPRGLRGAVTFGAAAVPARVVCLHLVATMIALGDMSAQGGSPAHSDGTQRPILRAGESGPIASQKGVTMLVHHIGDFEWRATHGRVSRSAGNASASKGLSVAWSAGCATWR